MNVIMMYHFHGAQSEVGVLDLNKVDEELRNELKRTMFKTAIQLEEETIEELRELEEKEVYPCQVEGVIYVYQK